MAIYTQLQKSPAGGSSNNNHNRVELQQPEPIIEADETLSDLPESETRK